MKTKLLVTLLLSIAISLGYYYFNLYYNIAQIEIEDGETHNITNNKIENKKEKILLSTGVLIDDILLTNTDEKQKVFIYEKKQFYTGEAILGKNDFDVFLNDNSLIYKKYAFPAPLEIEAKLPYSYLRGIKLKFKDGKSYHSFANEDGVFSLSGNVIKNTEKLEIIWNGDNKSKFIVLNKDINSTSDFLNLNFSYNISKNDGNVKDGKNMYLLRLYRNGSIIEKIFNIYFYDYSIETNLKLLDDFKEGGIGYTVNNNEYKLNLYRGKNILDIGNRKIIFYINNVKKKKSYFKIIENGKEFIYNNYPKSFGGLTVLDYKTGGLLFSNQFSIVYPHDYLYFSSKKGFLRIDNEVEKLVTNPYPGNLVKRNGNIFSVESIKTFDTGEKNHYKININIDTYESVLISADSQFPKPINIEYKLDLGLGILPKNKNISKIYFPFNSNNTSGITSAGNFTLKGEIINDVEQIEVIWDGDMDSYFLKNYIPGNKEFQYNISTKFGNIKVGKNKYLIRGYSKNGIYERIYTLDYYDLNKEIILKEIDKIFENEVKFNIGYTKKNHLYTLGVDYGKYIFNLGENNSIIFYNSINNEDSYIKIKLDGKEVSYKTSFRTQEMSTHDFYYNEGNILFSISGYESARNYIYFSKKFNKFIKIFDLIEENVKNPNWYNNTEIIDGNMIIKSLNNPWSEGENDYELKMNLDTLKIIK